MSEIDFSNSVPVSLIIALSRSFSRPFRSLRALAISFARCSACLRTSDTDKALPVSVVPANSVSEITPTILPANADL